MKIMRYGLLLLGLLVKVNFVVSMDGSDVVVPNEGVVASSPFDEPFSRLMSLEVDQVSRTAALQERIKKVPAQTGRTNVEMEDQAISDLYRQVESLHGSVVALQHVGFDQEKIRQLQGKLATILACLPDVSALADGEDDPSIDGGWGSGSKVAVAEKGLSEHGIKLSGQRTFSGGAGAVRNFVAGHKDKVAELSNVLLREVSNAAIQNLRSGHEENHNFNRLFCYHLARAAGYDDEDLVPTLLREMRECIEGSSEIVKAFNRVLVYDVRALLLGIRLLENRVVLQSYFDSLSSLATLTRHGGYKYTAYGTSDGIYTELQRVYNSLQIHVMRLRIEEISAALATELGDVSARREAEERKRVLQSEQDAQRLASVPERDRSAARRASLVKLAAAKQNEIRQIASTFGNNLSSDEIQQLLAKNQASIDQAIARFDDAVVAGGAAVLDAYQLSRRAIESSFDEARGAMESGAKRDMATKRSDALAAFEKARALRLQSLQAPTVSTVAGSTLGGDALARANSLWGKKVPGVVVEHDWSADKVVKGDAAALEEARQRKVQQEYIQILVSQIIAKKDLKKMKAIRISQLNALLDDTDFVMAINGLEQASYQEVVKGIGKAGFTTDHVTEVDETRVNRKAPFEKLKSIMGK